MRRAMAVYAVEGGDEEGKDGDEQARRRGKQQ